MLSFSLANLKESRDSISLTSFSQERYKTDTIDSDTICFLVISFNF